MTSTIVKSRKKTEKFTERMAKKTHFTENEVERLVAIQEKAMESSLKLLSYTTNEIRNT